MFLVYSDYFCCTGTYAANSYWVRSIKKLSSFWKEIFPNQCDFKEWARHTNVFKCLKNNRTLVNTFYWKQTKQQPKSKETLNLIDSFCLRIYPSIILPIHSIFIGHTLSYLLRSLVKNSLFLSLYKAKIPIQQSCDRVNTNTVGIQSFRKWVPCGDRRIMSISAHYSFPDLYSHSSVKCLNRTSLVAPNSQILHMLEIALCYDAQLIHEQGTRSSRKMSGNRMKRGLHSQNFPGKTVSS